MKRTRFDFVPRLQARMLAVEAPSTEAIASTVFVLSRQDPPLSDLDEVLMLLQTASEIEYSLLAEYLYAAYSLNPERYPLWSWRERLVGIAREEMGHLLGVQNLLLALGDYLLDTRKQTYPHIYQTSQ